MRPYALAAWTAPDAKQTANFSDDQSVTGAEDRVAANVMMVVPLDGEEDEAQQVEKKHRQHGADRGPVGAARHAKLEHHDRDQDGDDPVAESFQASLPHLRYLITPKNRQSSIGSGLVLPA